MRIGVMQGRLLPPWEGRHQCFPREHWKEEFPLAAEASVDSIEWIYDALSENENPLCSDHGVEEMSLLSKKHNIAVVSLCADYFMARPLAKVTGEEQEGRISRLLWLLDRCKLIGIRRVVLPFLDNSRIESDAEEAEVVRVLQRALVHAEKAEIELDLETSLDPQRLKSLLAKIPHPLLKVNYDLGNSTSLGYDPMEEIAAYSDRIGGVHIKDRVRGGGTVPLGSGDTKISTVLSLLFRAGYKGDFVMEAARGEAGKEVDWVRHNRNVVVSLLRDAGFVCGAKQ